MKILLHSYNFYPMIGGIETVSDTLATHLTERGIECTVLTQTPSALNDDDKFSYKVIRNPGFMEKYRIVKEHDVVFSNGTSVAMVLFAFLARKKFCWALQTYQLVAIDGSGWHDGGHAPMTPWKSFMFYLRLGMIKTALVGAFKLVMRRFIALNFCSANIAITEWVARRTPLPNQVVIYNPFPLEKFKAIDNDHTTKYDFVFLGRLVPEKGADVLIKAFALLIKQTHNAPYRLGLIGDGEDRERLTKMCVDLGIENQVTFVGKKSGKELVDAVSYGRIAVVPSTWEEPMGGVALEMLAAGKNIIVSQNGGLAELIDDAGLTFLNGDANDLKNKMQLLITNPDLRERQLAQAAIQLDKFKESRFVDQYIELFESLRPTDQSSSVKALHKPELLNS